MVDKETLENLERGFILDGDAEMENVERLIKRVSELAGVDKEGHVVIKDNTLSKRLREIDKILLALSVRFLASRLQEKLNRDVTISPMVTAEELSKYFGMKRDTATARLNDLKRERKIILKGKGKFSIAPYYIEVVLKKLESARNNNVHSP